MLKKQMDRDSLETEATKAFSKWLLYFTENLPITGLNPIHVSGCPGVRGAHYVSDVDVAIYVHPPLFNHTFAAMQKYDGKLCTIKDKRDNGWFSASFPWFHEGRTVNARFTISEEDCTRAARHRNNELILSELYPELAERVANLKLNADGTKNMSTEPAWKHVLNSGHEMGPYGYMMLPIDHLIRDANAVKKSS